MNVPCEYYPKQGNYHKRIKCTKGKERNTVSVKEKAANEENVARQVDVLAEENIPIVRLIGQFS